MHVGNDHYLERHLPICLGNFTPKTSNYCLKDRVLGFPGMFYHRKAYEVRCHFTIYSYLCGRTACFNHFFLVTACVHVSLLRGVVLLMEEIRLTTWYGKTPTNFRALWHPEWLAGFLNHQKSRKQIKFRLHVSGWVSWSYKLSSIITFFPWHLNYHFIKYMFYHLPTFVRLMSPHMIMTGQPTPHHVLYPPTEIKA